MKFYAAGWQSGTLEREKRLFDAGVFKYRCFSFANIVTIPGLPWHLPGIEAGYKFCLKKGIGIMLDSGVYSLRTYRAYLERKGKSTSSMPDDRDYVRMYVDFCKRYEGRIDFAVTVDFTCDCTPNFKTHARLEKMGLRSMPVYHGDDNTDYIRRYADKGYDYIAIGNPTGAERKRGTKLRRCLDAVFNLGEKLNLGFHGLAMTAPWIMLDYPWRSIDSSSWARVAGFGSILGWDERTRRLSTLHISERQSNGSLMHGNGRALDSVRRHVEAEGYDFNLLRKDNILRTQWNAAEMNKLADFAGRRRRTKWRLLV
jgi:hypothetical protein